MSGAWDYLLDDATVTKAWCGACSWHAEGKGINRGREIIEAANEHSELHPGVAVELDDEDLTTPRPEGRGFPASRPGVPVSRPAAPGRTRNV